MTRTALSIRSLALGLLGFAVLASCTTVTDISMKVESQVLAMPANGPVVEMARRAERSLGKGQSGFLLIDESKEALDWRLALADSAVRSIDIQYFLWDNSPSGNLLFLRLLEAADRGVRVRILVDDFLVSAKDSSFASIDSHPNMELRIFNPGLVRSSRLASLFEFVTNFSELNRRMHNKVFLVDNAVAIVGGRNIGDHYFGLDKKYNFRDLDVLTAGSVVKEIGPGYDLFWNASKSYPGQSLSKRGSLELLKELRDAAWEEAREQQADVLRSYPITRQDWAAKLAAFPKLMKKGQATFLQDHPEKGLAPRKLTRTLNQLGRENATQGELHVVSPYFIPSQGTLDRIGELVAQGTRVKILVPSMGANNHTPAHAHYRKYRRPVLEAGAELYEYHHEPSAAERSRADVTPVRSKKVALHTKTMVGDRERCFIGSLNLDPRAMEINTESGLWIDSPALSSQLADRLDVMMTPENSWQLKLDERGRIYWEGFGEIRYRQPAASATQRVVDFVARLLPIENQL